MNRMEQIQFLNRRLLAGLMAALLIALALLIGLISSLSGLAWFREQALLMWTYALCHLLLTGRCPEVRGRSSHIMDIALKIWFFNHQLRFFDQRLMASRLNDPSLMEGQGTETTTAKTSPVTDQTEFYF